MLMSLLTASADAGDDGGFSSTLSVPGMHHPRGRAVFRLTLPRKNQSKSGDYRMLASRRTPNCAPSRAIPFVRSRWAATAKRDKPPDVVAEAYARGVNYFFAYSMDDATIGDYLDGLRKLCSDKKTRKKIFVAVGMEDFTDKEKVTDHVAKCLARLGTDYVDAFYMEYVCRGDEEAAVAALEWMRNEGRVGGG
jgi:hypothetical protein